MNSFISKQILTTQTIGERLRKARDGADLSIEEVSISTRIKEDYIRAIEMGMYSELPGEVYALEFIKKYARFLRMDCARAAEAYKKEKQGTFCPPPAREKVFKYSRWMATSMITASSIAFIAYAVFFGRAFFSGPEIEIASPKEYIETSSSLITIQGTAKRAEKVMINMEQIQVEKDGSFIESFNLPYGMNIIRISAQSRLNKTTVKYIGILVKKESNNAIVLKTGR